MMMATHEITPNNPSNMTPLTPPATPCYYAIDVSKDTLHIGWQQDQHYHYQAIDNTLEAIAHWLAQPAHQPRWCILEYPGSYSYGLVYALTQAQCPYSLITPQQSACFAGVVKALAKTDRQDAIPLAVYGQRMQPRASSLTPASVHHYRQCLKHEADLRTQAQATANRLHALSYGPRATPSVVDSLQVLATCLAGQISAFEADLPTRNETDLGGVAQQMQTVVGIGPRTARALAVLTNGLQHFTSAKALVKYVGLAPRTAESGSSVRRRGKIARTGPGGVRGLLYMAARSAARHNGRCRLVYESLRRRGKCHKVAMVAVMNKLLQQVFRVVKEGIPFVNGHGIAEENLA